MRLLLLSFILFFMSFQQFIISLPTSAITYIAQGEKGGGGRLGDQLWKYCKAKWISHYYKIPLLYKPFKYSDQLVLHEQESHYKQEDKARFIKNVVISNVRSDRAIMSDANILYEIVFNASIKHAYKLENGKTTTIRDLFSACALDKNFSKKLKELIKPAIKINKVSPPINMITVAVHVRKGGGYDPPLFSRSIDFIDKKRPKKFPPDSYYIEQIKKLSNMYEDAPMYIHIFTDDPHPEKIAKKYEAEVGASNLCFGYREQDNHYDTNVLEDFFSMADFDCLIRPGSNFSKIAQLIGNHQVIIFPEHAKWEGDKLFIDGVKIIDKRNSRP